MVKKDSNYVLKGIFLIEALPNATKIILRKVH